MRRIADLRADGRGDAMARLAAARCCMSLSWPLDDAAALALTAITGHPARPPDIAWPAAVLAAYAARAAPAVHAASPPAGRRMGWIAAEADMARRAALDAMRPPWAAAARLAARVPAPYAAGSGQADVGCPPAGAVQPMPAGRMDLPDVAAAIDEILAAA